VRDDLRAVAFRAAAAGVERLPERGTHDQFAVADGRLRWANVDIERGRIGVVEQFNAKTRTFTLPKNGLTREAPLTEPAREAILALPDEGEFCFAPIRRRTLDRERPRVPLESR
jgi:hypothetical protein